MILKEILNRKVAVNCRTLSEADEFLRMIVKGSDGNTRFLRL
jgi:hypothetical protein